MICKWPNTKALKNQRLNLIVKITFLIYYDVFTALTLSDPGYFRQLTIRGGGGVKIPPYDLGNYCRNLHHIILFIHVYFTRCFRHVPVNTKTREQGSQSSRKLKMAPVTLNVGSHFGSRTIWVIKKIVSLPWWSHLDRNPIWTRGYDYDSLPTFSIVQANRLQGTLAILFVVTIRLSL